MADALRLPSLSSATLAAWNLFYSGSRSFDFRAAGQVWRFAPDAAAPPRRWQNTIHLRLGTWDAALFLENLLPVHWEGANLDQRVVAALPQELAGIALELVCRELAENTEKALQAPVSVIGLRLEEEDSLPLPSSLSFSLTRACGQGTRGQLAAETDCLIFVAEAFARHTRIKPRATAGLILSCRIAARGPELTARETSGLEAGDILLLPGTTRDREENGLPALLFLTRTSAAPARLKDATLLLEGSFMYTNADQPDKSGSDNADGVFANAVAPEDLPLSLAFDLGSVELTVAQAGALSPGQVLPTGRDTAAPVLITLAGRALGTGSLVDVSGRIGVRIETLALKHME
jgi:type III secretion protein Q